MISAEDTLVRVDLAEAVGDRARLSAEQSALLTQAQERLMVGDATAAHVVSLVLDRTITLPIYRWEGAQRSIAKLARRAAERGLPQPSITEVSRETRGEGDTAQEWITARILGSAPVLRGWRLLGTVVPGADGGVLAFGCSAQDMRCEHCGLPRRRALCFVAEHAEDGRTIQLGSTCADDYLGTDALVAWMLTSELHEIVGQIGSGSGAWDAADYAEWLAAHPRAKQAEPEVLTAPIAARDFLAAVVAEVRTSGYVSGKDAYARRSEGAIATGQAVWQAYQRSEHVAPTAEDFARADEIAAWIATLDASERDGWGEPTFTASLAYFYGCAARRDGVTLSGANTIAAAVPSYARHLERQAELASPSNAHLPGAIGDKIETAVTVRRVRGQWVNCEDSAGRVICYRARSRPALGQQLSIAGNISEFNDFQGRKQTVLTKVKVR